MRGWTGVWLGALVGCGVPPDVGIAPIDVRTDMGTAPTDAIRPADCDFVATGCYGSFFASVLLACPPPGEEIGTFGADGSTCSVGADWEVDFGAPIVPSDWVRPEASRAFTIRTGGEDCVTWMDEADETGRAGMRTLGRSGQTLSVDYELDGDTVVTCPDGTRWGMASTALEACDEAVDVTFSGTPSALLVTADRNREETTLVACTSK